MTTYKAVLLTKKGGPEVLQDVDLPLVEPKAGEARISIRATGAGGTDVLMRRGYYIFAPPIPFVQGYEVIGDVEALGPGVTSLQLGQRVAALTVHGGYAEKMVRPASEFVPVPEGLEDAEALALILNYVTAYQAIHRVAKVQSGSTALVTGANGGVGIAALELLKIANVKAIGAAAAKHHEAIRALGATPVEGRAAPIDAGVKAIYPEGVDASLDGLGGKYASQCINATKRGGIIVGYGFSGTTTFGSFLTFGSLFVTSRLKGRRGTFYGITGLYRKDPKPFQEDIKKLFEMLKAGQIKPKIAARLPLLAARQAAEMIEKGGIEGKIVHLANL